MIAIKMTTEVKIIADSISPTGVRITTMQLKYPRFIHSEFMTHRTFCISGGSILEFDLPSGSPGSRFKVHRMTVESFVDKWINGAASGPSSKHNGLTLNDLEDSVFYSAEEIRIHLCMVNRHNLNFLCREGVIEGAFKKEGSWTAPGKAWKTWRESTGTRRFNIRARLSSMKLRQVNESTWAIQHTTINDCVISGYKDVFSVSAGNTSVVASEDHMILTDNGWKPIRKLIVGVDSVCVYKLGTGVLPSRFTKIDGRWVASWNKQIRQDVYNRQGGVCALSGCPLSSDFHIHHLVPRHVDQTRAFDITNVIGITPDEHIKVHKKQGWQVGVPLGSTFVPIDKIEYAGVKMTYDISVTGEFQNFFANGMVVHNSRNASSSRAIPVNRMLKYVWNDPAIPIYWGSNKPGMQAGTELPTFRRLLAIGLWKLSGKAICIPVWCMAKLGLHKQVSNRLLEPWLHIHVVVTSTEWDNFFNLRCHKDAQPEIRQLAFKMKSMLTLSRPRYIDYGEWHLPYVNCLDRRNYSIEDTIKMSAARCCRVSYVNHEGKRASLKEDIDRYNSLVEADPPHMSPVEHQATPAISGEFFFFNLRGWKSQRWVLESQKTKE